MFPTGGVNLAELSQRLLTFRGLSVSLHELWIKCWSLIPCTDFVPMLKESWALAHSAHYWTSVAFFWFCVHPQHRKLVPQALRQCVLWEYTLSNHQLWNILRCLWLPKPIQGSAVLLAHRKDKTAPCSKWIPHCAGNRKVPHCPTTPSHFLFFAMQKHMEMN